MDGRKGIGGLRRLLGGLSTGQKLSAVTIIAVMASSGWWLGTSRPVSAGGMEPVLDQSFSIAELTSITERLRSQSIPHEIRENRVYVPKERRMAALADLYEVEAFRERSADGFTALVERMSAWDSPGKTDKLFNHNLQETLASMIMHWPGVRKATVIIDPTNERRMNGLSVRPTATVDIQTRADEADAAGAGGLLDRRRLADSAVTAVTGAVASLSREQVMVTIDGASYSAGAEAAGAARHAMEHAQQLEQLHAAKLRQFLRFIPDVMVSVSVDANAAGGGDAISGSGFAEGEYAVMGAAQAEVDRTDGDAIVANAVPKMTADGATDRPGVFPEIASTPPAVGETGAGGQPPATVEAAIRSVSVAVPRSYFEKIYMRASSNPSIHPDDALLQPIVDAQAATIRSLVKNSLGLASDEAVTVEAYDDGITVTGLSPVPAGAGTAAASTIGNPAALLNAHAKEIALVMMGIVLMLVLSMVFRRPVAGPAAMAMPASATAAGVRAVTAAARERQELLDGEIEDAPLPTVVPSVQLTHEQEAHQLFRRVRDMVSENPDDAARVLQDWIYENR